MSDQTPSSKRVVDTADPLEPFLCRELRRGARDVGHSADSEHGIAVITERFVERILALPIDWPITVVLLQRLRGLALPKADIDRKLVTGCLCRLANHPAPKAQSEAARKLAYLADRDEQASQMLRAMSAAESSCLSVRGHAAVGLWRSGTPLKDILEDLISVSGEVADTAVVEDQPAFLRDITTLIDQGSDEVAVTAVNVLQGLLPDPAVSDILMSALGHPEAWVRYRAALALGEQGLTDLALPTMIALLPNESVGIDAALPVGDWADRDVALPVVIASLDSANHWSQLKAVAILIKWGRTVEAMPKLLHLLGRMPTGPRMTEVLDDMQVAVIPESLPVLIQNLRHPWPPFGWHTVRLLQRWGRQRAAVAGLRELLTHEDSSVRHNTVAILGEWGYQDEVLDTARQLLRDSSPHIRRSMARTLRFWPRQSSLVPDLVGLFTDDDPIARLHAAATLGTWGGEGQAVPTVVRVLDEEHAATRGYAAELLVSWCAGEDAAATLLADLGINDRETIEFLASGRRVVGDAPSRSISAVLAKALSSDVTEHPGKTARRRVVFGWLWKAMEPNWSAPKWDAPL